MKSKTINFLALIALLTAGGFACSKDDNTDENLVTIQIKDWKDEVDPYIVSFALPGIVDARCFNGSEGIMPYLSYDGFPAALNPNDWFINLVLAKGTKRTKLAPVITLAPGCTITPKSGTVLDFSKNIEWTLTTPDGKTVKYYLASVFVEGDTDEANMVAIKLKCWGSGAVDSNIVSFALPGIFIAQVYEHPRYPDYGGIPGALSPHTWFIGLGMAKGTDCTKLAPIFSLAPGARIAEIIQRSGTQDISELVDYTGIAKVGPYDFTKQVDFVLRALDGSKVTYIIQAHDMGAY